MRLAVVQVLAVLAFVLKADAARPPGVGARPATEQA